ncbi:transcription termination factor Rho [Corynebacterium sanguinis]|uniref:Transcription termination factor Rho n=2 Tax=Corynebacterium sanguinis TaxID=2594913 RepID=A0A6C1TUX8_9CORY|nr:transcription termination factor Rho [Corynebacterium sanguinis]MBA4504799.1 transcription termination factor Rho [Corynebacterium sanguinis]MCT1556135.1 transcription termination factor Rho [Corynebacterium sanguinis]MDN8576998.1 transcription termination factor Rho [Corynebacterium sanguinis]TVS21431.1 transcription termination factor Rho [Corynebacterium sanguinis]TVS26662.1 transcription termination factor Rho [Corynebacterium sanguinis]
MTDTGNAAHGATQGNDHQDLATMKLPELRKLAAEKGLKGISALRKGDLIQAITTGEVPKRAAAAAPEEAAEAAAPRRRATRRAGGAAEADNAGADNSGANNADNSGSEDERRGQDNSSQDNSSQDEQRYESRSAARRARRNRARNSGGEGSNEGSHDNEDGNNAQDDNRDNHRNHDGDNRDNRDDRGDNRDSRDSRNNNRNHGNDDRNRDNQSNDDGNRRGRRNRRNRNRNGRDDNRDNRDNNRNNNQDFNPEDLQEVAGIVDVVDNNTAFVRTTGYRASQADVFIHNKLVRQNGLRSGDAVIGQVRANGQSHSHGNGRNRQRYNQLVRVDSVNAMSPENAKQRKEFHKLTPLYPNQRLRLETEPNILTTRVIDLVMPLGKGQRALIVSPPKAGKTTIMQNIANAIATNNPECYLMVVLVDERPEEVTDMQRSVKGEVISSTFDRPPSEHTAVAELAIERAKRLVEMGQDVVVLLDSITRLGRAYNNSSPASGRILSGGVDSNALYPPKRFLGAARNIEEGGSLTIIATAMVETGSAGDTVIFEEFKGTGNAELKLDRKIAERRVFPAVDVNPSGTRKDELLLAPEEARIMHKLRRILSALDPQQSIDMLIKQLKKTKSNGEFLMGVAQSAPMAADQNEEEYL